ncbi:MAG: hypothetical protein AAFR98_12905 [Pseudomonadota bacterium]
MLSYKENPFYVLAVSPQLPKPDIVAAYEDAILDHPDNMPDLVEARQNLLISRRRLEWELRWFPKTDPAAVSNALALLEGVETAKPSNLVGLAEMTFTAYQRNKFVEPYLQLADLFGALDPEDARSAINQDRDIAGFGHVDATNFDVEWQKLRSDLVSGALDSVRETAEPSEAMLRLVLSADGKPSATRAFVQEVVLRFDEWSAPKLSQIEKSIEDILTTSVPLTPDDVKLLTTHLQAWDKFRKPIRFHLFKIDAEDGRSLKVFGMFADALNAEGTFGDIDTGRELVLVLFPLMIDIFQGLPSAKNFLDSLEEQTTQARVFDDFGTALAQARKERWTFLSQLKSGQFRAKGTGIAGKLFKSARALHDMDGADQSRAVWVGLINLVVEALNANSPAEPLKSILSGLKSFGPPPDVECRKQIGELEHLLLNVAALQKAGRQQAYRAQSTEESGPSWIGSLVLLILIILVMSQCS